MNNNTINYLKGNYEVRAKELQKSISATNSVLNQLLSDLTADTSKLQKSKKYSEALEIVKIQQDVNQVIQENNKFTKAFDFKDEPIQSTATLTRPVTEHVDYDEYSVDNKVPYSLDEDFRHTRPHAFSIGKDTVLVSTWRELLIKTAEYLNKKDPELFKTFLTDKSMFWGDKANFVTKEEDVRDGVLIDGSNIYVETSKDSIATRQLVKRMIAKYGIKEEDYKVYLRANYASRHESKEDVEDESKTK